MRVVFDYRPALRARSGVGEYVHQAARAFALRFPDDRLTLFTSSWRDRPAPNLAADIAGARVSDHRVPVSILNAAWHWLESPPVEFLTGERYDVAFSPHPLLLPSRRAARVVMIHDLDFMSHPERTHREIRRDYPRLAKSHARRAARVVVPSEYTAREVVQRLGVARERVAVCSPGVPDWRDPVRPFARDGYILFMGTLERRKNLGALLAAYGRLIAMRPDAPKLVLAGQARDDARGDLDALSRAPLAGRVEHIGYVPPDDRQKVYAGARALVLPSFDEGFGMPVLEAMSLGIPVVVSDRGALPEVAGDAAVVVPPDDVQAIASALDRVSRDDALAESLAARGMERARRFTWTSTADALHGVFAAIVP